MTPEPAVAALVGFARTLRDAGLAVGQDRVLAFVQALTALDPARPGELYWAGRVTFCADPDDITRYDRAFAAYFAGWSPPRSQRGPSPTVTPPGGRGLADGTGDHAEPAGGVASSAEALHRLDIAGLDPVQRAELSRLLAAFRVTGEPRASRRPSRAARGRVDRPRTMRALLRHAGEPAALRHRRPATRPRRTVVLVDVSGSMAPYGQALLRFTHAAVRRAGCEVFTLGTRLTRVTRELGHRDPESAMTAVAEAVPDWAGGTRLGVLLAEFLDRWGRRGLARGAVVVILSDGWERDDPALLAEQMARLARLAHRVVWANPRKAQAGYEPLAAGMAAALPFVDDFVEGHSLGALERLARVIARPEPTRA